MFCHSHFPLISFLSYCYLHKGTSTVLFPYPLKYSISRAASSGSYILSECLPAAGAINYDMQTYSLVIVIVFLFIAVVFFPLVLYLYPQLLPLVFSVESFKTPCCQCLYPQAGITGGSTRGSSVGISCLFLYL